MASGKPARTGKKVSADLKKNWVCEDCGRPNVGTSPPDECQYCAHTYFDNLYDMLQRSGGSGEVFA
jgi:rubrerythrin